MERAKTERNENGFSRTFFCRMRNDLLNMIEVSSNASLDDVITEVLQIEDILDRRAKGERLAKHIQQAFSSKVDTSPKKRYNEDYTRRTPHWRNKEDTYNRYTRKTRDY